VKNQGLQHTLTNFFSRFEQPSLHRRIWDF